MMLVECYGVHSVNFSGNCLVDLTVGGIVCIVRAWDLHQAEMSSVALLQCGCFIVRSC